jgi:hypothetical protein
VDWVLICVSDRNFLPHCCCHVGVTTSAVAWGIALPGSMWNDHWRILQCSLSPMKVNTATHVPHQLAQP